MSPGQFGHHPELPEFTAGVTLLDVDDDLSLEPLHALVIVSLTAADRTPVRMCDVYRRYQNICEMTATEPLAQRSLHNCLQDLVMLGILNKRENRSGSWGNYNTYELDVPFEGSLSALEEKIDVGKKFDDLRGLADANGVA